MNDDNNTQNHGRTTKQSKEERKAISELLKAMAVLVEGKL